MHQNTIEDILNRILQDLKEAGYNLKNEDKTNIKNHGKGKLRKEKGLYIKWENGKGVLELNK